MHVDYVCAALRPLSEIDRVTQFKTCLCYYDGEMEVFDYGVVEVDLVFANSLRTFISVAQAINEMIMTLELTFGLQYQPWLQKRVDESRSTFGGASLRLRDRVLKEGKYVHAGCRSTVIMIWLSGIRSKNIFFLPFPFSKGTAKLHH